jgi:hypothetical protein
MNRGRRRENVFLDQEDYQQFIKILIESSSMRNINISAFCLMPNHYHLLTQTPEANKTVYNGDAYNVTVSSQPVAPPQICTVTNGSGVVAGGNINNVAVTCSADTTPPQITISSPTDKAVLYSNAVTVLGSAIEPLSSVQINGVSATISGFSFSLSNLPLSKGVI